MQLRVSTPQAAVCCCRTVIRMCHEGPLESKAAAPSRVCVLLDSQVFPSTCVLPTTSVGRHEVSRMGQRTRKLDDAIETLNGGAKSFRSHPRMSANSDPLLEEPSVGPTAVSKLHGACGLAMPECGFINAAAATLMKVA